MKIYVLLKQAYDENKRTVCVSEDIHKIRTSICEKLDANYDYPTFEIWENGELLSRTCGGNVLKRIADEMKE